MREETFLKQKYATFFNVVDDELYLYVKNNLNDEMTKLEKAIAIYLILGDFLQFDVEFALKWEWANILSPSDISLEKNDVICKNWSFLYSRLLRKIGISASSIDRSDFNHYYVEFDIDGVTYKADLTNYGGYYRSDYYYLSDLTNIKYGFLIDGIRISYWKSHGDINIKRREFSDALMKVYKMQNRRYVDEHKIEALRKKVRENIVSYAENVGFMSKEDINHRISIVNRFVRLIPGNFTVEKTQLFNKFIFEVFREFTIDEFDCYTFWFENEGRYKIIKLLSVASETGFRFFLDIDGVFTEYGVEDIKRIFDNNNALQCDISVILGLDLDVEKYSVR